MDGPSGPPTVENQQKKSNYIPSITHAKCLAPYLDVRKKAGILFALEIGKHIRVTFISVNK